MARILGPQVSGAQVVGRQTPPTEIGLSREENTALHPTGRRAALPNFSGKCDDDPKAPRELRREIPPELDACLRAMAKRWPETDSTAADFADDLCRVFQTPAEPSARREARSHHRP